MVRVMVRAQARARNKVAWEAMGGMAGVAVADVAAEARNKRLSSVR
jgi:hypothetical protein